MPDTTTSSPDNEMRALVERALTSSYEVDREIGRGGMGIVYRAKDRRLKRTVAIKVLPPELAFRGEIRSRFLREAETAAQLSHPNIVPIYSVDERDGLVYFVMACVDGVNLGRKLHDEGRLGVEQARRVLQEVGEALAYAHARGVIHRDIKPDNILLEADTGRAMVTDFGIARAIQEGADSRLTATGVAIGTPAYMSPEQASGDREIDGRSDLYSLGIVAYQMLTGEPPFIAASTATMLMKHLNERPVPVDHRRAEVSPDLSAIVMTLLEKEPERRFPSAASFVAVIESSDTAPYVPVPREREIAAHRAQDGMVGHDRSWSSAGDSERVGRVAATTDVLQPSAADVARWTAPAVEIFRKKFIFFAVVNSVVLVASVLTGMDLYPMTVFWGMYIAYKYAGLWTSGYDWRDVFRQPRDRRLVDVASETIEEARGIFDKERRLSRPARRVILPPASLPRTAIPSSDVPPPEQLGQFSATVRQADQDRSEIVRLVAALPKRDRQLVEDVVPSAQALFQRVRALAVSGAELERQAGTTHAGAQIEVQIAELEAQANPFEHAASEQRVRRLALMKRQRRALVDAVRRREQTAAKLESCALALRNMRFDIVRLRAGGVASALQHITTVTERARALADEVDSAVYAADEVAKVTSTPRPRLG